MKRRINLSLHWKSYFINLIWKCKAVWNAGFSLTFLLNMYESQISWCATLFIQGAFSWRVFFFPLTRFADGVWLWGTGLLTVTSGFSCAAWNLATQTLTSSPVKRRESTSAWALAVSKCCVWYLWNRMRKSTGSVYKLKPSKMFSKCSLDVLWLFGDKVQVVLLSCLSRGRHVYWALTTCQELL